MAGLRASWPGPDAVFLPTLGALQSWQPSLSPSSWAGAVSLGVKCGAAHIADTALFVFPNAVPSHPPQGHFQGSLPVNYLAVELHLVPGTTHVLPTCQDIGKLILCPILLPVCPNPSWYYLC